MRNPFRRRPAPPEEDLTELAVQLRDTWVAVSSAIPFPDVVEDAPGITDAGMDDPRVLSVLQAREVALGYALSRVLEHGVRYRSPSWMVRDLMKGGPLALGEDPS